MFYEDILNNYFAQLDDNKNLSKFHRGKSIEACVNQNFIVNQLCVLPFIEFELTLKEPNTPNLVYFDHPKGIKGCTSDMNELQVNNTQHPLYDLYIKNNSYNLLFMETDKEESVFKVRDFSHDFDREDPITTMYLANFDDVNVENLKPNKEEIAQLKKIIKRPNFSVLNPEEKDMMWRFRYFIKEFPQALPKFLVSVNWMIEKNIDEGLKFIRLWKQIEYDDAIFLLSQIFCANEIYPTE